MNQKFTKQERQKFLKGLQTVNLDSDSELQDSFYEKERKRVQQQISSLKTKKDWSILQQLKRNVQQQDEMMTEYEKDREQLHQITSNEAKNVIDQNLIEAIKQKVATQTNNSLLSLADQQYNQSVLANQSAIPPQISNASFMKGKNNIEKKIKRSKWQLDLIDLINHRGLQPRGQMAIIKKIEAANQQRQYLAMQLQDKLSLKYEQFLLSQLFKNRFIRPSFPKVVQTDAAIRLKQTKLIGSFFRLAIQPINQQTVLPKNAPQIALKYLTQIKRKPLRPSSKTQVKITLQKVANQQQNFEELSSNQKQSEKVKNEVDLVFKPIFQTLKRYCPAQIAQPLSTNPASFNLSLLFILQLKAGQFHYDLQSVAQALFQIFLVGAQFSLQQLSCESRNFAILQFLFELRYVFSLRYKQFLYQLQADTRAQARDPLYGMGWGYC